MVSSHGIPSSYTGQWRLEDRHSILPRSESLSDHGTQRQTYNTSCTSCRRVRVRCSGGKPCKRCEKNHIDPSFCIYDISRRHGKRKSRVLRGIDTASDLHSVERQSAVASNNQRPWHESSVSTLSSIDSLFNGGFSASSHWEPPFETSAQPLSAPLSSSTSSSNPSGTSAHSLHIDDFVGEEPDDPPLETDRMDPFTGSSLDRLFASEGRDECDMNAFPAKSCDCHSSNQTLLSHLTLASVEPNRIGLDQILLSLRRVCGHVGLYLECTRCDSGYPRFVNLGMLHQSQAMLLCNIAKNPTDYIRPYESPGAIRFTLGAYQLSEDEDLQQKRLAVLAAARQAASLVTDFDDVVRGHRDLELAGELEASDLAKINAKWLLDTTRNLKAQLNSILKILEQPGWAMTRQT